ncbi:hypothetical protein C8Q76DRAFT_760857 [Earliella scabrosa]|nr:hypothetical protein C8Q76DRAFT_760857 [Earliella scabrosa]
MEMLRPRPISTCPQRRAILGLDLPPNKSRRRGAAKHGQTSLCARRASVWGRGVLILRPVRLTSLPQIESFCRFMRTGDPSWFSLLRSLTILGAFAIPKTERVDYRRSHGNLSMRTGRRRWTAGFRTGRVQIAGTTGRYVHKNRNTLLMSLLLGSK